MRTSPEIDALVSDLLLEQGRYDPIELLLAEGRLAYEDYEQWRGAAGGYLEEALFGDPERTRAMLEQAARHARALGLEPERQQYLAWGGSERRSLACARDTDFDGLLRTRYRRPDDQPQLDLFMDSGSTVLANAVTRALAGRDAAEAQRALQRLRDGDPGHARLGQLERLVESARSVDLPVTDPAAELETLERQLVPLAEDLLGADARHFLAPLWRRLGQALLGLGFDPERPRLHASHTAERLGDWQGVVAAVEAEPDWRRQPELLRRHACARERLHEPWPALASWMLLCWRFPAQAEAIGRDAAPEWRAQWREFGELEPELPGEDFPAWLLLRRPGLAARLDAETLGAAPDTFGSICRLLSEDAGGGTMEARRALKNADPDLFTHYLQSMA